MRELGGRRRSFDALGLASSLQSQKRLSLPTRRRVPIEVAMKKRKDKYGERANQDFTAQLARALHVTPAAADDWLGTLLVDHAERQHAAALQRIE